ncbi:MAG: hypothetical protein ACREMY_19820 [bacterium]
MPKVSAALAAQLRDPRRGDDFVRYHAQDYTGVKRVVIPAVRPYAVKAGGRLIGAADTQAAAEALARFHRIDNRGARPRVKEQPRPCGGYAYIAV